PTRIALRMPTEADPRREVLVSVRERLAVVAKPEIEREIATHADAVLHEESIEPLLQDIVADAEIDGLRILLDVGECQLVERSRGGALKGERAENRRARFAA